MLCRNHVRANEHKVEESRPQIYQVCAFEDVGRSHGRQTMCLGRRATCAPRPLGEGVHTEAKKSHLNKSEAILVGHRANHHEGGGCSSP